jgi:Spy/CpxP family protein refolding chaperone
MTSRRIWAFSFAVAALVTVGAAGFLSASASSSGGPEGSGFHWGHRHGDRLGLELFLRQLNLTDAQRGQIKTIMSQQHESAAALYKQLHGEKETLSGKFFAPGALQASDLEPDVQKLASIQQQLLEQRIQTAVAIRNVLRPDQLAQAAQLKTQIQALREQMHNLLAPPAPKS